MEKQFNNALFCLILASFSPITNALYAQNKNAKKDKKETTKYLKVYLETSYEAEKTISQDNNYVNINEFKRFNIYPSFAFSKTKTNGRFFEMSFSLNNLEYSDNVTTTTPVSSPNITVSARGATSFSLAVGSRFEWAWRMLESEKSKFYVGISANPIFSYNKSVPYTTSSFPFYKFALTTNISIVPRWCWHLTDRLLLDVNVPLTFLQGEATYAYTANPVLPTFARTTNEVLANFVFKPQFRIGFGVKI